MVYDGSVRAAHPGVATMMNSQDDRFRCGRDPRRHGFHWLAGALLLALASVAAEAAAGDRVLYDDRAAEQFSELERVGEHGDAAYRGGAGLRVEPTYWHTPMLRLAGGRTDFRPYSILSFFVRSSGGAIDPTILVWDLARGRALKIADYAEGNRVDEQWRRVLIPVPDLASDAFALDTVFLIGFGPMQAPVPFEIDELVLLEQPPGDTPDPEEPDPQTPGGNDLVLYDDAAGMQFSELERIGEHGDAAYRGGAGLRVEPTYWHTPMLRLGGGRTDFRPYSTLSFQVRSTDGVLDPTIVVWDYARGRELRIADYADGGRVDEQWRTVRIPVADLASAEFGLESVYLIGFGPMDAPRPFEIDELVLHDRSRPTVLGWEPLSNRALALRFENLDHTSLAGAEDVRVWSETDPAYAAPRAPLDIGSSRRAAAVTPTGLDVRVESTVYLLLPEALQPGHGYRIALDGAQAPSGLGLSRPQLDLEYAEPEVSSSIKVNQIGYVPQATKQVFVGNWLGDLGPMPVDGMIFEVVDAVTGDAVYSDALELRAAQDPASGEDVYVGDFSAVTAPGSWRVVVPGIGRSHAFEIADDVYSDVYRATMRVFYHKRDTALTAPFADPGFERTGIDPLLTGLLHPVLADYPLSRGEEPFAFRPITPGWYDAGDYGQYIHNAAPVWGFIGLAMDLAAPGQFADGELDIPESGNGVPDVLDELGWGMDWALSMQDTDGGVYWRVCGAEWDLTLPGDVAEPRYIYEKTTRATAQFAAMGAIYSRLIRPYDPLRADTVLDAALRAWTYALTQPFWPPEGTRYENPEELPGGGTYAADSAKPDLLWAAAELYRTTGDPSFQARSRGLLAEVSIDLSAAPFSTFAFWALVKAEHPSRDVLLLEEARRSLAVAADIKLERAAASPYRSPKHPHIPFTGWSNFAGSPMWSLALLQAYHLTGQPLYLDLAWQVVDILLGANPLSRSWLTGIGDDPVTDPLDRVSLNDDNPQALRGLPVPGPTWHLAGYREPFVSVNQAYYPAEQPPAGDDWHNAYPVLRRYIDSHHLIPMNESTVRETAAIAVAFGLLRDGSITLPRLQPRYAWTPGAERSTTIYRLDDIPVADIPDLTPAQIAAFGADAVLASAERIAALTPVQVAAIDAPGTPYWVSKLGPDQQSALTADQIAAFTQWSLFTALPAPSVPLIPPAKMPLIGAELRATSDGWKAAITPEQRAAMTDEQRAILAAAGF